MGNFGGNLKSVHNIVSDTHSSLIVMEIKLKLYE